MIYLFASSISADQWIDASINIMNQSRALGSQVYPFLACIGLIRALVKYV